MDLLLERRALDLFETVLELDDEAREERLTELADGDPAVLDKVRELLRAHAGPKLIDTVPPGPEESLLDVAPERIGPYRVLGELGRGGMGVVYRAARDDGLFDQDVAIKLVRRRLFPNLALEQFARERRILARLHHPHVAQMFDAGVSETGGPYIVMELIAGEPITRAADRQALGVAGRLALFDQACEAVEFAHRNLIVHADVKPGNVVVADDFGVKLLDFGIADLLSAPDGEAPRPRAMTAGYASPAVVAGERPTVVDDVFSLGVLLRELLAFCGGGDRDLAAVTDKASSLSPGARYGSVRALSEDVARWRASQPVEARPPGRTGRLRLFWRRHRLAVSASTAAAVALVAVAVVTSTLYVRAEQRFRQTRELAGFMLGDVTEELKALPGSSLTRRAIAEKAQAALEQMSRVPGASRALRLDDALAFERVGETLADIDARGPTDARRAEVPLARAEAELRRLTASDPAAQEPRLALAETLVARSRLDMLSDNRRPQALHRLDEAAPCWRRCSRTIPPRLCPARSAGQSTSAAPTSWTGKATSDGSRR